MSDVRAYPLAKIMRDQTWATPYAELLDMALAIVRAGWAPPTPVVVETVEQMDDLPLGALVEVREVVYRKQTRSYFAWMAVGDPIRLGAEHVLDRGQTLLVYAPAR